MATLSWVGRDAVVDHHERVELRPLREIPELACGDSASGNLIIQGDNLLALRALLPEYAGKVKCLYVDPPYNTGTEGWVYNDRVDSPAMREWLGKVVGAHVSPDGEEPHGRGNEASKSEPLQLDRRDRWLSMMYPRLRLSKQLLSPDGLLAVSIDDREVNVLGVLLDEIFGAKNRLACAPWLAEPSGGKEKTGLRAGHEYLLIYHNGDNTSISRETRSTGALNLQDRWGRYRKGRELTKWGGVSLRSDRPGQWYSMRTPAGIEVWPVRNDGAEGHWRWGREHSMRPILEDPEQAHWELRAFDDGVLWNGQRERWVPYEKIREPSKSVGWSTWLDSHGFNADATRELKEILGRKAFDTPKPLALIRWLVRCGRGTIRGKCGAGFLSAAGGGVAGHRFAQQIGIRTLLCDLGRRHDGHGGRRVLQRGELAHERLAQVRLTPPEAGARERHHQREAGNDPCHARFARGSGRRG
ncbi:MAG: DNA methyltransferase [Gammaproteobacteria bacterium]